MLNKIWPIFIIIAISCAFINGNIGILNESIFTSVGDAVELTITFLGTMCLWNGLINVAYKTSMMDKFVKKMSPVINKLFPNIRSNPEAKQAVSMNIVANILGLGNAATPLGLKAMKTLQKDNTKKEELSNEMIMLIVLNTASLQIIPTTVIAIRTSMNSSNPTSIVLPVWIATAVAAVTAIVITKLLIKNRR